MDIICKIKIVTQCKRIKGFYTVLFLFCCLGGYAQYFSELYNNKGSAIEFGSIKEQNGNYYVTGATFSKSGQTYYEKALFDKIYQDGSTDSIIVLIDSDQYSYEIYFNTLKKTADGNFIAAGDMIDTTGKVFMMKVDTNGKILLWQKYTYPGEDLFHGQDIIEVPGQGYLIAANINFTIGSKSDVLIIRTDTSGNVLNQRLYSAGNAEWPWVIRSMTNGDYMVGACSVKDNTNTPYWAKTWLIEINNLGNEVRNWLDTDNKTMWPWGMTQTVDEGWILTRWYIASDSDDYQVYKASILKLDSALQKVWEIRFSDSTSYNSTLYDVEQLADGNFIACGIEPVWGGDSANLYGWLVKLNIDSTIIWENRILAVSRFGTQSFLYDINELPNGDLLACGELDYTYDVGITPIQQGWILRTDSNGCLLDQCWLGVNDVNPPDAIEVKEYPNPATNEIIFETGDEGKPTTITIYNLLGQKVMVSLSNHESKLDNPLKVETGLWQQGVYIWQARQDGYPVGQGKVEVIR